MRLLTGVIATARSLVASRSASPTSVGVVPSPIGSRRYHGASSRRTDVHHDPRDLEDRVTALEEWVREMEALRDSPSTLLNQTSKEARLADNVSRLTTQVRLLEERTISEWQVALTVSKIIAGIAFIAGTTYMVLKELGLIA